MLQKIYWTLCLKVCLYTALSQLFDYYQFDFETKNVKYHLKLKSYFFSTFFFNTSICSILYLVLTAWNLSFDIC